MATVFDNAALDELARGPGISGVVLDSAELIASIARADAPEASGAYKAGIKTRVKQQRRSVGVVEATDPKSLVIEAKKGVLARATKKAAKKR